MVRYRHNEPYYALNCENLEEDTVRVLSFKGEEGISRLFRYRIELISDDAELDPEDILNQKATFEMTRGEEDPVKVHGIISVFEQRGKTPNYVHYYAELVPRMWRLTLNTSSKVFQEKNVEQIVTQVLDDGGFAGTDYNFEDLGEEYPELEYVVQYNETDFDFINRRLEHFGIFYFFDHSGDDDVIVFTDSNESLPEIEEPEEIFYNPNRDPLDERESITEFLCRAKVMTGMVRLKDYNYRTPDVDLTVESQLDTEEPGTRSEYGPHYKDTTEGDFLARVRNQELVAQSKVFKGISDCRVLCPGSKFNIGRHYREDWNEMTFLLTKIVKTGTQRGLFNLLPDAPEVHPTYENHFEAIPADVDYRPPRRTPVPKFPGIMSAKVETGSDDEYAYLDDEGRYKVKVPFDLSDAGNGEASRAVRMVQPYSGPGYGIHFPNHSETEMIWSCINGDVDRPMGLGTVPNPSQSSPATSENKEQSVIRTAAGNEIILDDKTDEHQITIKTPDENILLFDDKDDKIELTTKDNHVATFDDQNKLINITTKDGHSFTMDDENKQISLVSKNGHWLSISDGDGGEMITLSDAGQSNYFVIDISNDKLVIMSSGGDIDLHAPSGTIDIKAKTLNVETSGKTKFKSDASYTVQSSGKSAFSAGGDFEVKTKQNYKMEADQESEMKSTLDMKCRGMNYEAKGDIGAKVEGGINVEVKSGLSAKFEGMMTEVKGGAMTKIQGGLVMIN